MGLLAERLHPREEMVVVFFLYARGCRKDNHHILTGLDVWKMGEYETRWSVVEEMGRGREDAGMSCRTELDACAISRDNK